MIQLWDLDGDQIIELRVQRDYAHLAQRHFDNQSQSWNIDIHQAIEMEKHYARLKDCVNLIAVSSDSRCAVFYHEDKTLRFWDLKDAKLLLSFTIGGGVKHIAMPDGRTIVVGYDSGALHFLRLEAVD
jgi:WD40 repeat protein